MSKPKYQKSKRPLPSRLPIIGPVIVAPYNPINSTIAMVALPNTFLARPLFSDERIVYQDDSFIVCTSRYFIRYLQLPSNLQEKGGKKLSQLSWHPEMTVGMLALKVTSTNQHVVADIYVDEAFRRQGIGTKLIERAHMDFPDLCLDGCFFNFGVAFFNARNRKS